MLLTHSFQHPPRFLEDTAREYGALSARITKDAERKNRYAVRKFSDGSTGVIIDEIHYADEIRRMRELANAFIYPQSFQRKILASTQNYIESCRSHPVLGPSLYAGGHPALGFMAEMAHQSLKDESFDFKMPEPYFISSYDMSPMASYQPRLSRMKPDEKLCVLINEYWLKDMNHADTAALLFHEFIHNLLTQLAVAHHKGELPPDHPHREAALIKYARCEFSANAYMLIRGVYDDDPEENICYEAQDHIFKALTGTLLPPPKPTLA